MCGDASNKMFRRILVAVDGSEQAGWATDVAGTLAQTLGAEVILVHAYRVEPGYSPELAVPIDELLAEKKEFGTALLRRHQLQLPSTLKVEQVLIEGAAAQQIVTVAEACCADLILVGAHGRGRLVQFLLGSTADSVIRRSRCPVLTVAHEPREHVDSKCCQTRPTSANKQRETAAAK